MRKLSGQEMAEILNDSPKKFGMFQIYRRMLEKSKTISAWLWHKGNFVPWLQGEGVQDYQSMGEKGVFFSKTHEHTHAHTPALTQVSFHTSFSIMYPKYNLIKHTYTHTHTQQDHVLCFTQCAIHLKTQDDFFLDKQF